MAQIPKKTVRKLVTLSVELAEEVDRFREEAGAQSDSDALKVLIAWGLTRRDAPRDLFERCQRATASGFTIGDVINSVLADHPLVQSTTIDAHGLYVYLRENPLAEHLRFVFSRENKSWKAEHASGPGEEWFGLTFAAKNPPPPTNAGRPVARGKVGELDDDIPF